jgi:Ribbon-helix-helix protein, copG family
MDLQRPVLTTPAGMVDLDSTRGTMECMAHRPTTVTMDEKVIEDLHADADRQGVSEEEVVEQAVRRFVRLDVLDEIWASNQPPKTRRTPLPLKNSASIAQYFGPPSHY